MSGGTEHFDVLVIGSGPAGQKAAIQAAKEGRRVAVIEKERGVGGACVHRGTIPSKALRETAMNLSAFRSRAASRLRVEVPPDMQLPSLMDRVERVVSAHVQFQSQQLARNGIEHVHGRARFGSPHTVEVESVFGDRRSLHGDLIVIATGSRPRTPPEIPVDHEAVLDSDSILSMAYLPKSLTVLGAGVIASEYASIFASLGVAVTMIDRGPRPLGFLDQEIVQRFVGAFEGNPGCTFMGNARITSVMWDGVCNVVTTLENGWQVKTEKMLCALGRVANVEGLCLEEAGLKTTDRGLLEVDDDCRTAVSHIFAVGDVIGPPALASSAMEQGRRAMRAALALPKPAHAELFPAGIYTIPEMSAIGLTEEEATARHGGCLVGRARFDELARAQISGRTDGLLKLVTDTAGERVLGCHIVGEGATELIHLAQLAASQGAPVSAFVDSIFNFPTLAEAYRVAALDVLAQRKAVVTPAS